MCQADLILDEKLPLKKQDGKHLIFQLEERGYGIPILKISEIVGLIEITPVPRTPYYIKGIVNLRGKIIPVMDLRLKLDMPEREYDKQTCIIIVNIMVGKEQKQIGVIVDIVSEVFDIPSTEIEAPPDYGTQSMGNFLEGVGKVKEKVVMLLNIEKIVCSEELIKLLDEKDCIEKTEVGV